MREEIENAPGEVLDHSEYLRDFFQYFENIKSAFLKFERGQTFQEPDSPSWQAFHNGDWAGALELIDSENLETKAYFDGLRERTIAARRLRIVEFPISPYLQWEFWVYRRNARLGEEIRVVTFGESGGLERDCDLPELVIIDESVAYNVLYDATGINSGAKKITDGRLIGTCVKLFNETYATATPVDEFFEEHIAPLPNPT